MSKLLKFFVLKGVTNLFVFTIILANVSVLLGINQFQKRKTQNKLTKEKEE